MASYQNKGNYMIVDDELLVKLERLSALKIEDSQRENIKKELSGVVEFVEILNELDLENSDVMVSVLDGATPLREDVAIKNSEVIDDLQKHAPSFANGYFVVPKIIE